MRGEACRLGLFAPMTQMFRAQQTDTTCPTQTCAAHARAKVGMAVLGPGESWMTTGGRFPSWSHAASRSSVRTLLGDTMRRDAFQTARESERPPLGMSSDHDSSRGRRCRQGGTVKHDVRSWPWMCLLTGPNKHFKALFQKKEKEAMTIIRHTVDSTVGNNTAVPTVD